MGRSLSTFKIAQLLDVNPSSVANWVDQNLLEAHRTPGGHRRVAVEDLVRFLRDHKMPVPEELDVPPGRILVVDDEPALCQMIAKTIRMSCPDCDVIEAQDGFKAGQIVATMGPDVVILDLKMPGLDGYEVCRSIKKQPEKSGTIVLVMTAFPSPESEKKAWECGADAYFTKPLDLESLIKAVKAAI